MSSNTCSCSPTSSFYNGPPIITFAASNTCAYSSFISFMTIVQNLILKSCKINDPCGRVIPTTVPDEEYDFIVIGGGSAGSVVTGRLAEVKGWKILLVEAGHDEPAWAQIPGLQCYSYNSDIDWQFETEPESNACLASKGRRCKWPRGKVLGGSSVINAMMYVRPVRKDIEKWLKAGLTTYTYEEMLRLYKKSEDNKNIGEPGIDPKYHGTDGPWTIQWFSDSLQNYSKNIFDAAREAGYFVQVDLNEDKGYGFAVFQSNTRDGMRLSLAKAFLRPQRNSSNLHVMLNTTASKIIISENPDDTKTASKVKVIYNNKTYTIKARKEIILAAGAIQSPQILLLSGIGPKDELEKFNITQVHNLPGVGHNLQDHPCVKLTYKSKIDDIALTSEDVNIYLANQTGPLSALKNENIHARLSSSYTTEDYPDGQYLFFPRTWCNPPGPREHPIVTILNQPRSKGYVGLHSTNIFDHPKIVANYFTNETDLKIMVELLRKAIKLSEQPSLKEELGLELKHEDYFKECLKDSEFDSDAFWKCVSKYGTHTMYHPCSTCKMGLTSDPEAVVNQEFQTFGISNLRIADASVLPSIISASLQATVVAFAEKCAELIKEKYLN